MKKQFDALKAKHTDAVLLFQIGAYYGAYNEDADIVAELTGVTVTELKGEKIASFPAHALNEYLPKLIRAGKRVAIIDQLEGPKPLVKADATEATASKTSNSTMAEVKNLPIREIKPSPRNPRKSFDEEAIAELAASIKQHGLLQPITVRPKDDLYEIVMGERRYRAMKQNEAASIPCIVREMTDEEALDAMITENLQRKDVDPIEEAAAFGQLLNIGKTIEQIAERFGKSKRFIAERLKLDNLDPNLKQWVSAERMNIGAALHICKLTAEEQQAFYDDFKERGEDAEKEPITKRDAVDYTSDLFMQIGHADWPETYEGACGITCAKCQFNSANVGCLFYEMKSKEANCTNRAKWDAKRLSWLKQVIDTNAEQLVKEGEAMESGKTVVITLGYFEDRCEEFQPIVQYIRDHGYKIVERDEYFERYISYREGDERLQAKIDANEVYRVLCVEANWRGVEICVRYFEFIKGKASGDEVEAMNLVNTYKENERKYTIATATKLRDVLKDMQPTDLSLQPLTKTEGLILMTLILRSCSYELRNALDLTTVSSEPKALNYARNHTDEVNRICRDYLRATLSSSGVEYNADLQECQQMLLEEWAKEAAEEVIADQMAKHSKKQAKIEEQLTALGYNTDGTKMDF